MLEPTSSANLKVPYDSLTLRAVVLELRRLLIGGQVQDIRQPSPCELRIGIRSLGKNQILLLSCDARFARAHLTASREPNAPTPPAFCMALRKHCEGAVVRAVRQKEFDRILEIEIGPRGVELDSTTTTIVAELMGKHSNLILVNAEGIVLEAAKRISRKINRVREVLPGLPYEAPPSQIGRLNPFDLSTVAAVHAEIQRQPDASTKERAAWLTEHVAGMSPFLALHIATSLRSDGPADVAIGVGVPPHHAQRPAGGASHSPSAAEDPGLLPRIWASIFTAIEREDFRPVAIYAGQQIVAAYPYPVSHIPTEAQRPVDELNRALDLAYSAAVTHATGSAIVAELRGEIERDRKRLLRQRSIAQRTLQEADRAELNKQAGELVLANLWRIEPGADKVTVQDYFDPALGDRVITLDPKLSAQENADALFRRYRKIRDGQATAEVRAAEAGQHLAILDSAAQKLVAMEHDADPGSAHLEQLRQELKSQGLLQSRGHDTGDGGPAGPDLQGHKIRRQTTPEGYEIYIGETATANDYLTTRLAAPNDLWLHVRASTSAHVVIKTRGKPDLVPKSVIEYAALVCARHSSQKHSGLVPVDYTLKKHVRKPRGAAPGSADYHHETTIHVEP